MRRLSRREFMGVGAAVAASFGLGPRMGRVLAAGLAAIYQQKKRILWLQAQSCSGCSVALLNSENPGVVEVLTGMVSLAFHSNVSAAQGSLALETVQRAIREGGYYLVIEGSIPSSMPEACVFGEQPIADVLEEACRRADLVIAAGSCSANGGLPAAEGNETGATSVQAFMTARGIPVEKRLVNCPGCPCHAESLVGTIAYAAAKGYPDVDKRLLAPLMFCRHSVHDDCPRFHYWQKQQFAKELGEDGCLFKLGCLGALSHADCSRRQWNGGVNWCIRAGAPCIGCTSENFGRRKDFPFYRKGEAYRDTPRDEQDSKGDAK